MLLRQAVLVLECVPVDSTRSRGPDRRRRRAGPAAAPRPLPTARHAADGRAATSRPRTLGVPRSVACVPPRPARRRRGGRGPVRTHQRPHRAQAPDGRPSSTAPAATKSPHRSPTVTTTSPEALLATAVADSTRTGRPVGDCLRAVARSAGRDLGEDTLAVVEETRSFRWATRCSHRRARAPRLRARGRRRLRDQAWQLPVPPAC